MRGNSVEFSWSVDPDPGFYLSPRFTLDFPESVDIREVPEGLWLRVMIICLHTHWALLRPCRVELPRRLPAGEREFWLRMIDAAVWTLENDRDTPGGPSYAQRTRRTVEIADAREPAGPLDPAPQNGGAVASFSSGRDSLAQAGILRELGLDPLLVTIRSSRVGSIEFETDRFSAVMAEIEQRGFERVEVGSDIRTCFVNDHPSVARYGLAVSELTDTLLYFAVCWAAAWSRGANAVYLAAEAEVQESIRREGAVVQIDHFVYSAVTQRAFSALAAPTGISYASAIATLEHFQVQRLLARRYPELRDLQYSCFLQAPGQDVCNNCFNCLKTSLHLMSEGVQPAEVSIDLDAVLQARSDWSPEDDGEVRGSVASLYGRRLNQNIVRVLRRLDAGQVAAFADGGRLSPAALAGFERLRATAFAAPDPPPEPGFRAGYLELLDESVRDRVHALLREQFDAAPSEHYAHLLENTRLLSDWIAGPLNRKAPAA